MASSFKQCLAETSGCVAYNLRKSSRIVAKLYEKEMRGAPLRGPQFSLTIIVAKRGTETITGLARDIGAELRRPLGIAIVGGLMFSQLLTLYTR
jgi:Cu/Ag efflux pump CusA